MIRTTTRVGAVDAAPRPVILTVVRCDNPAVIPSRHPQRPAWSLLYAIVFLALVALSVIDFLVAEGLARSLTQLLAIFVCIGLTRLWNHANRWSLARIKERRTPFRIGSPLDRRPARREERR